MKLFPLLDEFPLRAEEIVTGVVCAVALLGDHYRQPTFSTMCGRKAKWPGHAEVNHATTVTCIACWERVLPKEA